MIFCKHQVPNNSVIFQRPLDCRPYCKHNSTGSTTYSMHFFSEANQPIPYIHFNSHLDTFSISCRCIHKRIFQHFSDSFYIAPIAGFDEVILVVVKRNIWKINRLHFFSSLTSTPNAVNRRKKKSFSQFMLVIDLEMGQNYY